MGQVCTHIQTFDNHPKVRQNSASMKSSRLWYTQYISVYTRMKFSSWYIPRWSLYIPIWPSYPELSWVISVSGFQMNSHFFTCLFTKMAICGFGGWESWKEVTGSSLVLKNACICLRASFSWVGNNPSLQIHSVCENRAKCDWTCDPTNEVFSSVLMRQDLHVANSSYLP